MRFFKNANYPFLQQRRRAYVISALALLVGIAGMVYYGATGAGWLNYGVDFTGGTLVQLRFNEPVTVEQIRSAAGNRGWEIVRFGDEDEFLVRMGSFEQDTGEGASSRIAEALAPTFSAPADTTAAAEAAADYVVTRTEAVGPKVGSELQAKALWAILLSFGATLIYLWFRFEWRFGVAAVIATAHDILLTLGFLAVTRTEITLTTVAAVLTIVGYSLNDTIVVFDRIREEFTRPRGGKSYLDVLNKAINETLPRTTLTSVTTLLTLLSLFLFGGPVIRDFAMVLILGIVIGTYSSIFVASPALAEIEKRWPHRPKEHKPVVPSRHRERAGART